jgi:hypothetical protein
MPLTQRTGQLLQMDQEGLRQIQWSDGEANTDTGFSRLACECCLEAWEHIQKDYPEYKDLTLSTKAPDIHVSLLKDSTVVATGKIELKSGKNVLIPGSTIGNLDINEPVIFCLRNELAGRFHIRYSQYYSCIGESNTDMFQDRTPRPHVNFQKMLDVGTMVDYIHKDKADWVDHYANCAVLRTKSKKPYRSWQDSLSEKIMKIAVESFIKGTTVEEFAKLKAE